MSFVSLSMYCLFTVFVGSAVAEVAQYSDEIKAQKLLWKDFKHTFKRSYELEEDHERFQIFVNNLKLVDKLQKQEITAGTSAEFGITKFSDLTSVR